MPTPAIRINGGSAGVKASVSASSSVTATLDSTDGVRSCTWSVVGTDETTSAASYTLSQSGSVGQTVTFTSGAAGTAGILRVEINGGIDLQTEQASDATRATCKWYVPTSGGAEVGCVNETTESSSTYGWTGIVNQGVRAVGSGIADVTGSAPIVVTGTTTKAVSVSAATTLAAGSMSAADKTKLDNIKYVTGTPAATGEFKVGGDGFEYYDTTTSSAQKTSRKWIPQNGVGGTNNAFDMEVITVGAGDTVVLPVDTAVAHPATVLVVNNDAVASVNVNSTGGELISSALVTSVSLPATQSALFIGNGQGVYAMFQGV